MTASFDPAGFKFDLAQIGRVGKNLDRPECVLCNRQGDIVTSHWKGGGVTLIRPDGRETDIATNLANMGTNGFAITPEGEFLLANLHVDGGGIWLLKKDGSCQPFLTEINGTKLPPANFVGMDRRRRIWISISTRHEPRTKAFRGDIADGFIVLLADGKVSIAADDLGYTNEAVVDPAGQYLYVNETFGRRTSRFRIRDGNTLGSREVVAEYGHGTFPDGLAFDAEGGLWVTSVVSNRLIHVDTAGRQNIILEDNQPDILDRVEQAFMSGQLRHDHMNAMPTKVLRNISSISFGGPDRKTIFLGNLYDSCIYTLPSPVAGTEPVHWNVNL